MHVLPYLLGSWTHACALIAPLDISSFWAYLIPVWAIGLMKALMAYLIPVWEIELINAPYGLSYPSLSNRTVGDRKTLWVILIPVWEIGLMNFTLLTIPSWSTVFTKGSIDLALIPVMGHRSEHTTLIIMWYTHDPTDRLIWSSLICTLSAEIILDHLYKFNHTFSCLALNANMVLIVY